MFTQEYPRVIRQQIDEFGGSGFPPSAAMPDTNQTIIPAQGLDALNDKQVQELGDALKRYQATDKPRELATVLAAALEGVRFNNSREKLRREKKADDTVHPAEALAPVAIAVLASSNTQEATAALAQAFMASDRDGQLFKQILPELLERTGPGVMAAIERAIMSQRVAIKDVIPTLARNWDESAETWAFARIHRDGPMLKQLVEVLQQNRKPLEINAELPRRALCHWLLQTQDEAVAENLMKFLGHSKNKDEEHILKPAVASLEKGWGRWKRRVPTMQLGEKRRCQVIALLGAACPASLWSDPAFSEEVRRAAMKVKVPAKS